MPRHNVYRDGKVHVLAEKCATCVFRPGNLMHLQPGRLTDLVEQAVAAGSGIVCHATLDTDTNALCRGFWAGHRDRVQALQVAERLDRVAYDPPPPKEDPDGA